MTKQRIGILGSGDVGQSLGKGFVELGHDVMLGTRDPKAEKAVAWQKTLGGKPKLGTFHDAAVFGELIVLATKWEGTENALELAKPSVLKGKIVMDATNPLVMRKDAQPTLALGHTDSGGEQVQRWLRGTHVVKVFNTVGHAHMVNPRFEGGPPDMFIGGNDEGAKKTVSEICKAFGWSPVDLGGIEAARVLEPICLAWCIVGWRGGGWNHAFKLLRA